MQDDNKSSTSKYLIHWQTWFNPKLFLLNYSTLILSLALFRAWGFQLFFDFIVVIFVDLVFGFFLGGGGYLFSLFRFGVLPVLLGVF